jgi:NADPH-dependent 2,4-dienoyl-CoA reductase/sulfur reductase-like enzyme
VTQVEQLPEVLPTLDPELGALVADELRAHGVEVHTSARVASIECKDDRLVVHGANTNTGEVFDQETDLVLVVTGVRPDTALAAEAGAQLSARRAIIVDRYMRTGLADVFAAGDCVSTFHVLAGDTYVPLGTTAHKQGRIAGENALGGNRAFAGSTGTQVVKIFDLVAARTGLRDHEAVTAGYDPLTVAATADDHKAYYPGAQSVQVRITGDTYSERLLGAQLVGRIPTAVHKRVDTAAAAIFGRLTVDELNDLDLSYTPPLGSPWDVLQAAAQQWLRARSSL